MMIFLLFSHKFFNKTNLSKFNLKFKVNHKQMLFYRHLKHKLNQKLFLIKTKQCDLIKLLEIT